MKKICFSYRNIYVFSSYYFSFIGSDHFSFNFHAFQKFGEIQKYKMADLRWLPFGNRDVINTSYDKGVFCLHENNVATT